MLGKESEFFKLLRAQLRRGHQHSVDRRGAITLVALIAGAIVLGLLWPGKQHRRSEPTMPPATVPAAAESLGDAPAPDKEPELFERIRHERTVRYDRLEVDRGARRR